MRRSNRTPSIVPRGGGGQNVCLVMDDLGRNGQVWRSADVGADKIEAVILDVLEGQYKIPVRVVPFPTPPKSGPQDVSADVAQELRRRCNLQQRDILFFLQGVVGRSEGRYRDFRVATARCSWSDRGVVRTIPRTDRVVDGSHLQDPAGRRNLYPQAATGAARRQGMADRNALPDPGIRFCRSGRVRADRRFARAAP